MPKMEHRKSVHTHCNLVSGDNGTGSSGGSSSGGGAAGGGGGGGGLISRIEYLSTLPEPCVQIAILQSFQSPPQSSPPPLPHHHQQQQQPVNSPPHAKAATTCNLLNHINTSSSSSSSSSSSGSYDNHDNHGRSVVIGLSQRGKLFCGESLLVAGVSSFVANVTLDVLMYVTTGTRPVLQFVSISALAAMDPLAMEGNIL